MHYNSRHWYCSFRALKSLTTKFSVFVLVTCQHTNFTCVPRIHQLTWYYISSGYYIGSFLNNFINENYIIFIGYALTPPSFSTCHSIHSFMPLLCNRQEDIVSFLLHNTVFSKTGRKIKQKGSFVLMYIY
jgi:hypothetical protein